MQVSHPIQDLVETPQFEVDEAGHPHLAGSRCGSCDALAFPFREVCYRCGAREALPATLSDTGAIYSWTRVRVSSVLPTPYAVSYIDLTGPNGDGVRVFAQLIDESEPWRIGQKVHLTTSENAPGGWAFTQDTDDLDTAQEAP